MGALQQTERTLRRLNIENMRIQVRMLEKLIAEEEKELDAEEERQESNCGCSGRSEMIVSDN